MILPIVEIVSVFSRALTGQLLTEPQLRRLTQLAVGTYLSQFLAPTESQVESQQRIDSAKHHIQQASAIVSSLQEELEHQISLLETLENEVIRRREEARRYEVLASTSASSVAAIRAELEVAVQSQLRAESERGRNGRRAASLTVWLITLVLGAFLGAWLETVMG